MVQHVCTPGELLTPLAWQPVGARGAVLHSCWRQVQVPMPVAAKEPKSTETIPLHWACATGQVDCAMLLLDARAVRTGHKAAGRPDATRHGSSRRVSVARLLIERGCNVNEPECGASPLYGACQEGHAEIVRPRRGPSQHPTGSYPLWCVPLFAAAGTATCLRRAASECKGGHDHGRKGRHDSAIARNAVAHRRGSGPGRCVALLEEHARRLEAQPALPPLFAAALDVADPAGAPEAYPVTPTELVELVRGAQTCRLREVLTRATGCVVTPAIIDLPAGTASDPPLPDGIRIGGRTPLVAA